MSRTFLCLKTTHDLLWKPSLQGSNISHLRKRRVVSSPIFLGNRGWDLERRWWNYEVTIWRTTIKRVFFFHFFQVDEDTSSKTRVLRLGRPLKDVTRRWKGLSSRPTVLQVDCDIDLTGVSGNDGPKTCFDLEHLSSVLFSSSTAIRFLWHLCTSMGFWSFVAVLACIWFWFWVTKYEIRLVVPV